MTRSPISLDLISLLEDSIRRRKWKVGEKVERLKRRRLYLITEGHADHATQLDETINRYEDEYQRYSLRAQKMTLERKNRADCAELILQKRRIAKEAKKHLSRRTSAFSWKSICCLPFSRNTMAYQKI